MSFISPVMMAVLGCAIIVGPLLFAAPVHGYSDSGNFQQLLTANDLFQLQQPDAGYLVEQYGLMRYYNQFHLNHLTTQSLVIQIAIGLNRLFYSQTIFNIRFLGAVHYLLYLGGVATFATGLIGNVQSKRNYVLTGLVVLMAADSAFTLYFNSFYPQALTFILMLYTVGLFLLIMRYKKENVWYTIGFFVAAFLLLMVSQANSLLCIALIPAGIGILIRPNTHWVHGTTVCFTGLLLLVGWLSWHNVTPEVSEMNHYEALTQGKMLATAQPEKISQTSEIDPQFTLMKGQSYYPNGYAVLKPDGAYTRAHLSRHYNLPWLLTAYGSDLAQFNRLLDRTARNTMLIRPKRVGTQSPRSGQQPFHQTKYWMVFSHILATFYPRKYVFNCLLAVTIALIYIIDAVRHLKSGRRWQAYGGWLMMGLLLCVVCVPPTTLVLYGTANVSSHLFPVAMSLYLIGLIIFSDVVQHRLWRSNEDEPS